MKEKRLAHLLMSVLGLENSTRSNELHKWNETGDLSASVFKHVAGTVKFVSLGKIGHF